MAHQLLSCQAEQNALLLRDLNQEAHYCGISDKNTWQDRGYYEFHHLFILFSEPIFLSIIFFLKQQQYQQQTSSISCVYNTLHFINFNNITYSFLKK